MNNDSYKNSMFMGIGSTFKKFDRVLIALIMGFVLLAIFATNQLVPSLTFMLSALARIAPFIALSVIMTAYVNATGADNLISKAFQGNKIIMIIFAAFMGVLSPFCSCGVIPLIEHF